MDLVEPKAWIVLIGVILILWLIYPLVEYAYVINFQLLDKLKVLFSNLNIGLINSLIDAIIG